MDFIFEGELYTVDTSQHCEYVSVFKDGYFYRTITWQNVQENRLSWFKDAFVQKFVDEMNKGKEQ